jgi:hypothetical protein
MKDTIQEISDFISSLFDVFGIAEHPDHGTLIIVGLESTPERNLDEFGRTDDEIKLFGFEKYMSPLLESAVSFIRNKGYTPELVGRHGYPLRGQLNLKELAIQTGIGKRGNHRVSIDYGINNRQRAFLCPVPAPEYQIPLSVPAWPGISGLPCRGRNRLPGKPLASRSGVAGRSSGRR